MAGSQFYQGVEFKACAICKRLKRGCIDDGYLQAVTGKTSGGDEILACGHVKPVGKPVVSEAEGRRRIALSSPPVDTPIN